MEKILISACLLGEAVRYHGGNARIEHPILRRWNAEGRLVPVCPEVAGGLGTPRLPAEIVMTSAGRRVLTIGGDDVTGAFERGADMAVQVSASNHIRIAILKDESPSCGSTSVHDGSFTGRRTEGLGLTAARLVAAGVTVFSETQIEEAAAHLALVEGRTQI